MKYVSLATTLVSLCVPSFAFGVELPAAAKPVPGAELKRTVAGKTQDGTWYFAPDGKLFASGQLFQASSGTWTATDAGRVCADAVHVSLGNVALKEPGVRVVQCWDYQQVGTAIYRRAARNSNSNNRFNMLGAETSPTDLIAMDWVVFKGAKPDPKDAINTVVTGDKVTPKLKEFASLATFTAPAKNKWGDKVTRDAVKTALWGKTAVNQNNPQFTITIAPDGATSIDAGNTPATSKGASRIVGDLYCIQAPLDQPERCFWIYKNGDLYSYVIPSKPEGTLNFSFTLR